MTCPRPSDGELIANAAVWAAAILDDALAHRLDWHTVWVLTAIVADDPSIRPEDTVPVLRLAMAVVDLAVIELGLEAAA